MHLKGRSLYCTNLTLFEPLGSTAEEELLGEARTGSFYIVD
jgi:hypothetical protein